MTAVVSAHRPSVMEIVAAILLPPLGVFLARGLGPAFLISLALTVLFWVPGVLFSLVAVVRPDFLPGK